MTRRNDVSAAPPKAGEARCATRDKSKSKSKSKNGSGDLKPTENRIKRLPAPVYNALDATIFIAFCGCGAVTQPCATCQRPKRATR
jgi:hypothetical protein